MYWIYLTGCLLVCLQTKVLGCYFGTEPSACTFQCHCAKSESCNSSTGGCNERGCSVGRPYQDLSIHPFAWRGPACQIGNVAHMKKAYQTGKESDSYKAIDATYLSDNHCAHPTMENDHAMWWVDLGSQHVIFNITIFNSDNQEEANQLINFLVTVTNSSEGYPAAIECGNYQDTVVTVGGSITLACPNHTIGQYVRVKKDKSPRKMALREVVVEGYTVLNGRDCSLCSENTQCSGDTFAILGCTECRAGKKNKPWCNQTCENYYYGVDCSSSCGRCADRKSCDPETGHCPQGCEKWYLGDTCKTYIYSYNERYTSNLRAGDVTPTTIDLSWSQHNAIPADVSNYYGYGVFYKFRGQPNSEYILANVRPHTGHGVLQTATVRGLRPNTGYDFNIRIFRQWQRFTEDMNSTNREFGVYLQETAKATSMTTDSQLATTISNTTTTSSKTTTTTTTLSSTIRTKYTPVSTSLNSVAMLTSPTIFSTDIGNATTPPLDQNAIIGGSVGAFGLAIIIIVMAVYLIRLNRQVTDTISLGRHRKSWFSRKKGDDSKTIGDHKGYSIPEPDSSPQLHSPPPLAAPSTTTTAKPPKPPKPVNPVTPAPKPPHDAARPVAVPALGKLVRSWANNPSLSKDEYKNLPKDDHEYCGMGHEVEYKPQNRFINIHPYEHSRVIVGVKGKNEEYINANFIKGYLGVERAYVATQGPKDNTLDTFWRMLWQLRVNRIVMVTCIQEDSSPKPRCSVYWPAEVGATKTFGDISVTATSVEEFTDFIIRIMVVKKQNERYQLCLFHYLAWADKTRPDFSFPLLAFRAKVRSFDAQRTGPLVVHCSAGVGRTGTYIALDALLQQADAEGCVDVHGYVTSLRKDRMSMVQTKDQYVFIYESLHEAYISRDTASSTSSPPPASAKRQQHFQMLCTLRPELIEPENRDGLDEENMAKNRSAATVPEDTNRPYLSLIPPCEQTDNYINAAFADTFHREDAIITTQWPLPHTVADFWRMVRDHNCRTLVVLSHPQTDKQSTPEYWPAAEECKARYGRLDVRHVHEARPRPSVIVRDFTVSPACTQGARRRDYDNLPGASEDEEEMGEEVEEEEGAAPLSVRQFQLTSWLEGKLVPDPCGDMLDLLELLADWLPKLNDSQDAHLLLQCLDGVERCGMFCVSKFVIDKMKADQEVNVFLAARYVTCKRPETIQSFEQYNFVHTLASNHIDRNQLYANVNQ